MGQLFQSVVVLSLGAFVMSAVFTKYKLSLRLAFFVMSRVGQRPAIVMLAIMVLGVFLSMWYV
jgi:di/tricarboxylate transporter